MEAKKSSDGHVEPTLVKDIALENDNGDIRDEVARDVGLEVDNAGNMGALDVPDSEDESAKVIAPASVDAGSMDVAVVPDSEGEEDEVCVCKREVHGVKDFEECRRVRREQSRCSRCGLVHKDHDMSAWIIDGFDTFDCELYIPNVDELQMEGETEGR